MIPRLHKRGRSFKGACSYVLHDPEKSNSADRVAWTSTRNLVSVGAGCLVVRLDNRERVVVALDRYRNIAHGYAMTVHKAQGVTVDRAHVLAGRSMDRHMAYVAMSRHRVGMTLHYGRDQFASQSALVAGLSRRRLKDTTLDYTALDHTFLARTGHAPLSKETRSDRIRTQAIDWRRRNPEKDFGLEMQSG